MQSIATADMKSFPREALDAGPKGKEEESAPAKPKRGRGRPKKKVEPPSAEAVEQVSKLAKAKKDEASLDERTAKIRKIRNYFKKLGDRLGSRCPPSLERMSSEQLDAVLAEIRYELGSFSGLGMLETAYQESLRALGPISKLPPLQRFDLELEAPYSLYNTAKTPDHMAEVRPILQELVIEYEWFFVAGPVKRLVTATVILAKRISDANRQAKMQASAAEPVSADLEAEIAALEQEQ